MMCAEQVRHPKETYQYSNQENDWLDEMRKAICGIPLHPTYSNDFNMLRWLYAYEGDVMLAARKYRRHLKIREILQLDTIEEQTEADGIDEAADEYAPMTFVGEIDSGDSRILLLEQSGRFDLSQIMQTIRTSAFMLNRFRLMERILRRIQIKENETGRIGSAVLVLDLHGLKFQPSLVGFISGPYRIMWGTLIEQYPSLISKILVINAPTFMNVLWGACSSFIPSDYRSKIFLTGENWRDKVNDHFPLESMPICYGGLRDVNVFAPNPCNPICSFDQTALDSCSLECLTIPAGSTMVNIFYLNQTEIIEFYMQHEQELTMNIFFTTTRHNLPENSLEYGDQTEEVFAGCERPGMPTLDSWRWRVPYTGFYHVMFGNEKAWIMSVNLKYQIFQIHQNGSKIKVTPIPPQR
ncbi:CRAL/TRIO domain-containing protein [Ditylenchus destructor]|nr:CRAL/TRIO domain-containing protein [Ditylenchus destructor]